MDFSLEYTLGSKPEWIKDKGTGRISIRGLSISMKLIPYATTDGKLQANFTQEIGDQEFEMNDYQVHLQGQTDFPKAFDFVINNFKDFFKVEVAYLLTDSASRAF